MKYSYAKQFILGWREGCAVRGEKVDPKKLRKAIREVDSIVGDRLVTFLSLHKLGYRKQLNENDYRGR